MKNLAEAEKLLYFVPGIQDVVAGDGRKEICFDFDWRFYLEPSDKHVDASAADFDDSGWNVVQTPHDFSALQPFDKDALAGGSGGHLPGGVGWYRKYFHVVDDFDAKRAYIEFDGVYRNSDVWLNGELLGHRQYGYAPFRYELTDLLEPGEINVIAVRADNSDQPNCRWYSGSGIYRHVKLVMTEPSAIAPWGVCITTENALTDTASVRVRTTIDASERVSLQTRLFDAGGEEIAKDSVTVEVGSEADQTLLVKKPRLWSPETPVLYSAVSVVADESGAVLDEVRTVFGIREIEFDADRGFLLNGTVTKLKGGNIHHDGGCVGAAVPEAVWRRRLEVIKSIGGNCVRFSHNPPAAEVLDLCDEIGLLAYDEAFDKWSSTFEHVPWLDNTNPTFDEDWQQDLDAMLLRDRNHPSVIIWSVGNEVVEYGQDPKKCLDIYRKLAARVKELDPTRPVTQALIPVGHRDEALHASGLAEEVDIISVNYQEPYYLSDREKRPDKLIIGSETKPFFTTARESRNAHFLPRNPWQDVVDNDFVIGGLLWSIIDYLGEAQWPRNGWCTGIIDTAGFLKARSNYFQCAWQETPQVRIQVRDGSLPIVAGKLSWDAPRVAEHWNWPNRESDIVHVETPSNCETVELLLNGESCGTRATADSPNHTIEWYVPYEPGLLEAIGRNGGKEVTRRQLETTGAAAKLEVMLDRTKLDGSGHDAVHAEIRIVDAEGRLVPDADSYVNVNVRGHGELLGMDNGDQLSKEPFWTPRRRTHFGRCLAVVRARRGAGTISIQAISEELAGDEVSIRVLE